MSAMSVMRRKASSRRISMTSSLARSSSLSLVLPLAPQQQKSGVLCTLRRAQSSIPTIEYVVVSSDFGTADNYQNSNPNKSYHPNSQVVDSSNINAINKGDGDGDGYCSDYTSCSSSIADLRDVLDEPQRVSKDLLRSVSISYQWLDLTLKEFEPTTSIETAVTDWTATTARASDEQSGATTIGSAEVRQTITAGPGLPVGRQGSIRFAYIHDCKTGRSYVCHTDLKIAMEGLGHWTMQVPRNCCLSYRHDTTGEVATLPWPDLEAGSMDEVEEFVSTVNRVEGRPVFFPRYERSPFESGNSLCSQKSLSSQKGSSSQSSPALPPLPFTPMRL